MSLAISRFRASWWPFGGGSAEADNAAEEAARHAAELDAKRREADAKIEDVLQVGKEMLDDRVREAEQAIADAGGRGERKILDELERWKHDHVLIVQRQIQVTENFLPAEIKRDLGEVLRLMSDYGLS